MLSLDLYLTPTVKQQALDAIGKGVPPNAALVAAGVNTRTVYGWFWAMERKQWPDGSPVSDSTLATLTALTDEIAQARLTFESSRVQSIAEAAETVNEKTGQKDWRANAWLLNNLPHTRRTYHEFREQQTTVNGQVNHSHRAVSQMAGAEVVELLPDEWRALLEPPSLTRAQEEGGG